jgi:hypothetical protein
MCRTMFIFLDEFRTLIDSRGGHQMLRKID